MKNETKGSINNLLQPLAKHPFLSVIGMCVLLFFFGFCEKTSLTDFSYIYAGAVVLVIVVLMIVYSEICKNLKEAACVFLAAVSLTAGGLFLMHSYDNSPVFLLWLSFVLLAFLCMVMWLTGSLNERNFIILMIAAGIMLRFVYDLYTGWRDRQHDVGYFNWTWGHANYIEYWRDNGLKLPDFDVRTRFQYYQPPLHHMLMGLLMKILESCGMENAKACEAIQFLPFLYSSIIMVVSYKIFRLVKLRGLPLTAAMAVLCFHPTFVLMGGSFNNDILSAMLALFAVMFALRWYQKPTLKRIIPIALSIGLGMMAKLSAWMVAPAIAIMFLYVFVKNIKLWKRFIGQFAVFGVICVPLGLWWQVRNLLLFEVPLTYVPLISDETHPQYCGNMSVFERLFSFGGSQLSYVYPAFTEHGAPYNDFNPTLGIIKTALFDEGDNGISVVNFPQIAVTGSIFFWIGVLLAALCFVGFIISMISKKTDMDGLTRVFFAAIAVTMLVSYYLYCFKYAFTCSMNIRFCVPLIPILIMGLGLLLQRFSGDRLQERCFRGAAYILVAAFAVMSCVIFSQVGLPVS